MYDILLLATATKDLDHFRGKAFTQIMDKVFILGKNPRPPGCLKLTDEDGYRLRSENYRILYRIDDKAKKIFIYRVKHRKEAYK